MQKTASSLATLKEARQSGFQIRLGPTTDEKSLLPACEAAQQLDLRAFHSEDCSQNLNDGLIGLSLIWRRANSDFDSTAYLTRYAISAGARLSPNDQDAAFGMFRHVNHNFRPNLQTAQCPNE
jgi:cytosine/adenosine deaminase-related metal-dependent hydrolase